MPHKRPFGELEWLITQIVEEKGPVTVRVVMESLGEQDRYTTILTVMSRMAEKGILSRQREGNRDVYSLQKESKSLPSSLKTWLTKKKPVSFFRALLEQTSFSKEELDELDTLIQQAKKEKQ